MKYLFYVLYAPIYVIGCILYWPGLFLCLFADQLLKVKGLLFVSDVFWVLGRVVQALAFYLLLNPRIGSKLLRTLKDTRL